MSVCAWCHSEYGEDGLPTRELSLAEYAAVESHGICKSCAGVVLGQVDLNGFPKLEKFGPGRLLCRGKKPGEYFVTHESIIKMCEWAKMSPKDLEVCPDCGDKNLFPVSGDRAAINPVSRRGGSRYVCNVCGDREAREDLSS